MTQAITQRTQLLDMAIHSVCLGSQHVSVDAWLLLLPKHSADLGQRESGSLPQGYQRKTR